jgi:putative transposase
VKFINHRELKKNEIIKSCTISKAASGKYYISVVVEGSTNIEQININKNKVFGLDYAMNGLYIANLI